ncbi:hypothetical protein EMN47_08270 [Prolixibacteraceae bacterium JC049]|nr:hypothetical protein [Prolixibacteraceae bacterium JC049]
MENFFDSRRMLEVIWKWKIHFGIIAVLAFALAALFSSPMFIRPKYKSEARLYPINVESYSNESESEQMLEIVGSMDIKRHMFDAFKLGNYYGIKKDDPYYRTKLIRKYNKNVSIKKTEYETVEIAVMDWEPQRASNMIDSIICYYNEKLRKIHGKKYKELATAAHNDLKKRENEIKDVTVAIEKITKEYGILDFEMQVKELSKGYAEALAAGKTQAANKIQSMLDRMSLKGGEFEVLSTKLENLQVQSDTLKVRYDKALSRSQQRISYAQVVESPFPADKKSYPVRWLIALLAVAGAEILALLVILLLENGKKQ